MENRESRYGTVMISLATYWEIMVVPRKSVEPWEMGLNAQNGFMKRTTLTIIKSNEVGKAPDTPTKVGT